MCSNNVSFTKIGFWTHLAHTPWFSGLCCGVLWCSLTQKESLTQTDKAHETLSQAARHLHILKKGYSSQSSFIWVSKCATGISLQIFTLSGFLLCQRNYQSFVEERAVLPTCVYLFTASLGAQGPEPLDFLTTHRPTRLKIKAASMLVSAKITHFHQNPVFILHQGVCSGYAGLIAPCLTTW